MSDIASLYQRLTDACADRSRDAAVRIVTELEPDRGPDSVIHPPTYVGTQGSNWRGYRIEQRPDPETRELVDTVLLDSTQSQANRIEQALVDAIDDGELNLPVLEVDLPDGTGDVRVTNLTAPHRHADAYFRDSHVDGVAFDRTDIGAALLAARKRTARALYQHAPTSLIFGFWDSHRGRSGGRIARAYTAETVGYRAQPVANTASRSEPLALPGFALADDDPNGWKLKPAGEAIDAKQDEAAKKSTSNIGHGSLPGKVDGCGGVVCDRIVRRASVSFAQLRQLRFPDVDGHRSADVDAAGRAALAAIALAGEALAFGAGVVTLRSETTLCTVDETVEIVGRDGTEPFELDVDTALALARHAVAAAADAGLVFGPGMVLQPSDALAEYIDRGLQA